MFGDRLKELRKIKDLHQQDIADILNVSKSTIAMWETNKREPNIETIKIVSEYFAVPVNFLLELGAFSNWNIIIKKKESVVELLKECFLEPVSSYLNNPILLINAIDSIVVRIEFNGEDMNIYLKGSDDDDVNTNERIKQVFTQDEIRHIKKYRFLDKYGKKAIDDLLNTEFERCMTVPFIETNQKSGEEDL